MSLAPSRADLQVHSTASDGVLTPREVVALARECRVDAVALTDHDTTAGVAEAAEHGATIGVRVVGGVELSAARDGAAVHVLGLFCRVDGGPLHEELRAMREHREWRAGEIVRRLNSIGHAVTLDDVRAEAGAGVIGRPHVARALVRSGVVADVASAFTPALLADGGAADVPKRELDPRAAVRLVHDAGGVAVVAHPARSGLGDPLLAELASIGLDGIEADHPEHTPAQRAGLRALARRLGLVATGGSDFHDPATRRIGACTTTTEAFEALERAAAARAAR